MSATHPGPGAERVVAVLGPTNTGKTHLAIERMLGHRTGMMGFPLRLLARENYDKVVRAKGAGAVALVTGEEKIVPPNPLYWICTVESMPVDRPVSFLAIDEVQLAADHDRGHVFTDRILHARGMDETMFLGADTVRPILQRLVPRAEHITRPRFSSLTYAGHKKLTRLPPRSAVVAFSATDVYAMAELIRRQRGGTAVVLGALSPRTRNAQVALYQAGEVDYLVATDAIGMGLNMDVDHVAFARLTKFDGHSPRKLRPNEIAQIAGRAGRHMADGTFGTTGELAGMDEATVTAVEGHQFESLKAVMWRNSELDFRSVRLLLASLEERPTAPQLMRAREADDHLALQALAREAEVARLAINFDAVRLLWDVCGIPDFRKVLSDAHARLLSQIYRLLMERDGRLPQDFVASQVARLDRVEGDIDALVARIAHVRTWTYVSHRMGWLDDPLHWQERTRAIEDRLSDALHERLTQRFIDRRSAGLVKSLRASQEDGKELLGAVTRDGAVLVEGHPVGELEGLRFTLHEDVQEADARAVMSAARRALKEEMAARVRRLEEAPNDEFALATDGTIAWQGAAVGRLTAGADVLAPLVRPLHDELIDAAQRDRVTARLMRFVQAQLRLRLAPLFALQVIAFSGPARGIAFQIVEALGAVPRAQLDGLIAGLSKADRALLARAGVRLGFSHVFVPALVKPQAVALRALLFDVRRAAAGALVISEVPPPGRVTLPVPEGRYPAGFLAAVGYPPVGPRAIRVDMLDRLEKLLADSARAEPGKKPVLADLAPAGQLLGLGAEEIEAVLVALGYRRRDGEAGWVRGPRRRPKGPPPAANDMPRRRPAAESAADHPFASLRRFVAP